MNTLVLETVEVELVDSSEGRKQCIDNNKYRYNISSDREGLLRSSSSSFGHNPDATCSIVVSKINRFTF